jgi:hypothetical protein
MRALLVPLLTMAAVQTLGACGETDTSEPASDASVADAAGESDAPASPLGTWQLEYGSGCEGAGPDLAFVRSSSASTYEADFADRRPLPSACGSAEPPEYLAGATYDALAHELVLTLDTRWCFSGEDQCDRRSVVLTLSGASGTGTLQWTRCWNPDPAGPPVTCSATATRLAEPADCVTVVGHDVCAGGAVCNSGCGTACRCENGLWSCDYPPLGSLCRDGESCTYKQSNLGGFDGLSCVEVGGEPRFDGSLMQAGSVCPPTQPPAGELCGPWPEALACPYPAAATSCTCQTADGGAKAWACGS